MNCVIDIKKKKTCESRQLYAEKNLEFLQCANENNCKFYQAIRGGGGITQNSNISHR